MWASATAPNSFCGYLQATRCSFEEVFLCCFRGRDCGLHGWILLRWCNNRRVVVWVLACAVDVCLGLLGTRCVTELCALHCQKQN